MTTIKQITILAPGLIGGSLGQALKKSGFAGTIVGWGRRATSLASAQQLGAIDRYDLDLAQAIDGADIIVIATPTCVTATILQQLAPIVSDTVIITDVASVKGNVLRAAKAAFGNVPANLVLGHPIAGSEQSGVAAAKSDLFVNHHVVLTPTDETNPAAVQRVTQMWQATGANVSLVAVDEHDRLLAATSHLPHLLAFSFINALADQQGDIFRFTGGGFRDFSRIAASDAVMWQEITHANREAIIQQMDQFSAQWAQLRNAVDESDGETIRELFQRAKAVRERAVEQ